MPTWGVFLDEEKQGGGPLIDIGTHALDLTLWMMDNYKPKAVLGTAFHKLSQKENAANAWGSWDPQKFTVEDSAFGMITMQNGATIVLESSWAINMLQTGEAKTTLCGTEGGADMWDGLRINGEKHSRLFTNEIQLDAKGVDFYDGAKESPADLEARMWLEAIENDTDPVVTPEQACVVSEILEAIYESSKTGKAVYFEEKITQKKRTGSRPCFGTFLFIIGARKFALCLFAIRHLARGSSPWRGAASDLYRHQLLLLLFALLLPFGFLRFLGVHCCPLRFPEGIVSIHPRVKSACCLGVRAVFAPAVSLLQGHGLRLRRCRIAVR